MHTTPHEYDAMPQCTLEEQFSPPFLLFQEFACEPLQDQFLGILK